MRQTVSSVLAAAGIGAGSRVCCALSGGVDSVVLLHLLDGLRAESGFHLQAAHVHHGLNPRADDWARACAARCAALSIPFSLFHVDLARKDGDGLEAAARRARHAALEGIACDWLAFGHHQDDQAETVLFRLLRGTGVRGAGAMTAVEPAAGGRPGRVRPLLERRRADIEAWAREHALDWVEDDSNADLRHMRNDLRHRLLPACSERFPAAVPALARAAAHFREAGALLDELAAIDEAACGGERLQRSALLALSDARIRNLLRARFQRLRQPPPSQARLDEALRQLREASPDLGLRLELGSLACCAYRDEIWLEPALRPASEAQLWRGETSLPWSQGRVDFVATQGTGVAASALQAAREVRLQGYPAGQRFRPASAHSGARRPSRSFRRLCQEYGIPAWLRARLPVLTIDGEVAWVAGAGVSAAFACAPDAPGLMPRWVRLPDGAVLPAG